MARQNQVYTHELATNQQNLVSNNTNQYSTENTTMIITQPESASKTTNDQYHHTETIWRILVDIISLTICKK